MFSDYLVIKHQYIYFHQKITQGTTNKKMIVVVFLLITLFSVRVTMVMGRG